MYNKDYSKTAMYVISHKDDVNKEEFYLGSTQNVVKRRNKHKSDCNNPNSKSHNLKLYKFIRENGGWDNWVFCEIEKYPCNSKRECEARERYWFDTLKPTLNKNRPRLNDTETNRYEFDEKYRENQKLQKRQRYKSDDAHRSYKKDKALKRYYDNREKIKDKRNERYHNDPVYREKMKAKALKRYHDKKNENNVSH